MPLIIIIPFAYFISSKIDSTKRIATYIRVFHESDTTQLKWETRFNQFIKSNRSDYGFSILLIFISISLICFFLFLLWPNQSNLKDCIQESQYYNITSLGLALLTYLIFLFLLNCFRKIKGRATVILVLILLPISIWFCYGQFEDIEGVNPETDQEGIIAYLIGITLSIILVASLHKIYWAENKVEEGYHEYWKSTKDGTPETLQENLS